MIDQHGGRDVLAATNLVFAAGLVCLSFASGVAGLAFAWVVLGIGMGFGLYEAAFATAAGLYGREARNAITGITLFAGFAGTVGWPASAFFIDTFGWRGACLAWAVLHLLIGLPMNRLLVPKTAPHPPKRGACAAASGLPWTMIVLAACSARPGLSRRLWPRTCRGCWKRWARRRRLRFRRLAGGTCSGRGARLIEFCLLRRMSPMISARLATGLHPIGAILLAIFGPVAAVPFVLLHGAGNGMLTIARGTLPLALFGPAGYGCAPASSPRRHASSKAARRCSSASCSIGAVRSWPCCSRLAHRPLLPRALHAEPTRTRACFRLTIRPRREIEVIGSCRRPSPARVCHPVCCNPVSARQCDSVAGAQGRFRRACMWSRAI